MEKVYISAPWPLKPQALAAKGLCEQAGIEVTSQWITQPQTAQLSHAWATVDLADVAAADVLMALNPLEWEDKGTGGRHVEFGYALASGKGIVIVGTRTNVFHYLNWILVVPDIESAIWYVKNRRAIRER
jgi:nucleoside 2-deoxyribosyltransferase